MFYYMYQITNLVNHKIYVGVHKTNDLNDGYMGSGKIIRSAITKHGISNFSKVILEQFDDSTAMYAREAEVVTEEFLAREDVYNLRRGGHGGFDYINKNTSHEEMSRRAKLSNTPEMRIHYNNKNWGLNNINTRAKSYDTQRLNGLGFHSVYIRNMGVQSAKRQDSIIKRINTFSKIEHQQGDKNSQAGTMWITNGVESKKIKKTDLIPEHYQKGRLILSTK